MSTPPLHTAPPPEAVTAFQEAFRVWELRRASVVAVALACAKAWREDSAPIAGHLDWLGEVTRLDEEADAALQALHEAAPTRSRSDGAP